MGKLEKITEEEREKILKALPAINGSISQELAETLWNIEGRLIKGAFPQEAYNNLVALFNYCNWPVHEGFPFEFRKASQTYCNPRYISREKIEAWLKQY